MNGRDPRQTGLVRHFEFVLAEGDYVRHKPHPESYQKAAARLGIDPARCLVAEDTQRGLVSARVAGMECVVIPNALSNRATSRGRARDSSAMRELPGLLGIA
ncbi:MAG: hypothetical protein CL933_06480 [Deltaproteobacteria bacterium]|nr:hypothetical protein [Deltaproteobacteria bacterium]